MRSKSALGLLFFGGLFLVIGHFRQVVGDALVAIDARQAGLESLRHDLLRSLSLLVRVHRQDRVTVTAFA